MKNSTSIRGLVATFVIIGLGASSAVLGQTVLPVEVTVTYADLNLDNEEGAKALYTRLQSASRRACGNMAPQISGVIGRLDFDQCYREALAGAVEKIDNDNLTRIHSG